MYVMYFDHIHPLPAPLYSQIYLPPISKSMSISMSVSMTTSGLRLHLYLPRRVQFVRSIYSWGWGYPLGDDQRTKRHTLKENRLSLPYKPSTMSSSSARARVGVELLPFHGRTLTNSILSHAGDHSCCEFTALTMLYPEDPLSSWSSLTSFNLSAYLP